MAPPDGGRLLHALHRRRRGRTRPDYFAWVADPRARADPRLSRRRRCHVPHRPPGHDRRHSRRAATQCPFNRVKCSFAELPGAEADASPFARRSPAWILLHGRRRLPAVDPTAADGGCADARRRDSSSEDPDSSTFKRDGPGGAWVDQPPRDRVRGTIANALADVFAYIARAEDLRSRADRSSRSAGPRCSRASARAQLQDDAWARERSSGPRSIPRPASPGSGRRQGDPGSMEARREVATIASGRPAAPGSGRARMAAATSAGMCTLAGTVHGRRDRKGNERRARAAQAAAGVWLPSLDSAHSSAASSSGSVTGAWQAKCSHT